MRLCAISFKECWRNGNGQWYSSGGFPLQMAAIGSLFDEMTLVITEGKPANGGIPLPEHAKVISVPQSAGKDTPRKVSFMFHLPQYVSMLLTHIRQADVIHVPLPGDIPFLGMILALLMRKRLVARYGGSWFANSQTTLMNRVTRAVMRCFAGNRNVMLITGEHSDSLIPNMHWIFASAVSRNEFAEITPVLERGLSSPPRLVYIGRLSPEKGLPNLIRATAYLKHEGFKPLPFIELIGDGPQKVMLEQLIREYNVTSFFILKGQLDRYSLSKELIQMDFCVQPSLTEGYSKAWLDAFLHGLPVLASDVGSARSVIGQNGERGWLVPPGDVQALGVMLRRVLAEPVDWRSLRFRCRAFVGERTLEDWAYNIGQVCVKQWNISHFDGKLHL